MKLDATDIRYLSNDTFRVLTAVEMGSKNHEIVPSSLIASISGLRAGGANKCIGELAKRGLVKKECNSKYDGYRLTYGGYDYLAIRALSKRDSIYSVGNQIGVGKEADVYVVATQDGTQRVLKIHRLGRVSFRAIKSKRDYLQKRRNASWMYMSRLAAQKEFAFMKVLHQHGFPVPEPVDQARHCLVMSLIDGFPLRQIHDIKEPGKLYSSLMDLIVKLAQVGLIHGDFNEFNLLIDASDPDNPVPVLIDFPQMVSVEHENAEYYFNRDVQCIRSFFLKRFRYESRLYPKFNLTVREGKREMNLDVEVEASGWGKGESRKLEEYMEMIDLEESCTEEEEEGDKTGEDSEEEREEKQNEETESSSGSQCSEDAPETEQGLSELGEADESVNQSRSLNEWKNPTKNRKLKKEPAILTSDQLTAIVAKRLEKTRIYNQRKHHSKKSIKSFGRQKGSKLKNDKKQLTSLEF